MIEIIQFELSFNSRTSQLKLPAGVILKRSDKQKQGKIFKIKIFYEKILQVFCVIYLLLISYLCRRST